MRQQLAQDVQHNEYYAFKGTEVFDASPEWGGGAGAAEIRLMCRPAELFQLRQGGGSLKLVGEHIFIEVPKNGLDPIAE